jgi:hypothetical protein
MDVISCQFKLEFAIVTEFSVTQHIVTELYFQNDILHQPLIETGT